MAEAVLQPSMRLLHNRHTKERAMKLVPLMTVHADLKPPADIGMDPYGTRMGER
jgi:hypothetical protein